MIWFKPMQMFFATPAAPVVTADGGGSPSAPSGGGAPSPAPAAPAAPTIDWNTAPQHLRQAYETQKKTLEELQNKYGWVDKAGIKGPEEAQQFRGGYEQVYNEIKSTADNLGIDEREIADAIRNYGLIRVLDHLRQEAYDAEQAQNGDQAALRERDLQERIESMVEQRLSPIQQRENSRMVQEANSLVERTIVQSATETFGKQGLDWNKFPDDLKDFVMTGVTEALKYDDEGMKEIKFSGKTASVQRAFQNFMSMFDAAYLARRQMETGAPRPPARPGQQPPAQPGKAKSIDELIDNPDRIRELGGRPVYTT